MDIGSLLNTEPCIWEIYGCTDINAINYNTLATIDDGSCILPFFFNWDNEQREYWLYIPENLPENAPLVFARMDMVFQVEVLMDLKILRIRFYYLFSYRIR